MYQNNQDVFAITDFEWAFTLLEALSSELAESLKRLTDEAFEDMRRCNECKKLRNARFVVAYWPPGKEGDMRENLKNARKAANMTQQQVAEKIGISLRYYQNIEQGSRTGDFAIWDNLEDLFNIHQRKLREISDNHPDREDNP